MSSLEVARFLIILLCEIPILPTQSSIAEDYFYEILPSIVNSSDYAYYLYEGKQAPHQDENVINGHPPSDTGNITMKSWNILPESNTPVADLSSRLIHVISEVLHVTVEVQKNETNSDAFVYLENCYASAGDTLKASIVRNGCAVTNSIFQTVIIESGVSDSARLSYRSFDFHHSVARTFIWCEVLFCKSACPPKCLNIRRRRRRSSDHDDGSRIHFGGATVSGGPSSPVKLQDELESDLKRSIKSSENSSVAPGYNNNNNMRSIILPIMLICTNLLILALLGFVAYSLAKSRARCRRKFVTEMWQDDMSSGRLFPATKVELITMMPSSEPHIQDTTSLSYLFCNDAKCQVLKDIETRNHRIFKTGILEEASATMTEPSSLKSPPSRERSSGDAMTSIKMPPEVVLE